MPPKITYVPSVLLKYYLACWQELFQIEEITFPVILPYTYDEIVEELKKRGEI